MTESSPHLETPTPPKKSNSWFLGLLGRLIFLSLVGGISLGAGAALAVFYPDRKPQAPFLETALQNLHLTGETRVDPTPNSSPDSRLISSTPLTDLAPSPSSSFAATTTPTPSAPSIPSSSGTPLSTTLGAAEKEKLQQDLQKAQQELKGLNDRAASLEQKLGISTPTGSLESRLKDISRQLAPGPSPILIPTTSSAQPSPSPSSTGSTPNLASPTSPTGFTSSGTPIPNPPLRSNQKKITLPPDSLFDKESSILRPEAILLLSQVVNELQGIAGTSIQVTAHTNLMGEPNSDRRLSFQQAKSIREYLATQLGDRFRFITIGYGSTRPLFTPVGESDRRRNRRIEIIVE